MLISNTKDFREGPYYRYRWALHFWRKASHSAFGITQVRVSPGLSRCLPWLQSKIFDLEGPQTGPSDKERSWNGTSVPLRLMLHTYEYLDRSLLFQYWVPSCPPPNSKRKFWKSVEKHGKAITPLHRSRHYFPLKQVILTNNFYSVADRGTDEQIKIPKTVVNPFFLDFCGGQRSRVPLPLPPVKVMYREFTVCDCVEKLSLFQTKTCFNQSHLTALKPAKI